MSVKDKLLPKNLTRALRHYLYGPTPDQVSSLRLLHEAECRLLELEK